MVKRNRIVIFVALTNRRLILCQMGQRAMARHSGSAESLTLMSKCRSLPAFESPQKGARVVSRGRRALQKAPHKIEAQRRQRDVEPISLGSSPDGKTNGQRQHCDKNFSQRKPRHGNPPLGASGSVHLPNTVPEAEPACRPNAAAALLRK